MPTVPAAVLAVILVSAPAGAQLTPDRTYYGVGRTIPMTVALDPSLGGEAEIRLHDPVSGQERARAAVAPGGVDLGALFPVLWSGEDRRVLYAQLVLRGTDAAEPDRRVGPPVVLQPLVEPLYAVLDRRGVVQFQAESGGGGKVFSGLRAYVDQDVVLDTTLGQIRLRMRPDAAPNTVWNFRELVRGGFYTGTPFHRVVPFRPDGTRFVIQGGDPTGTGDGGPGYMIDLEPSTLEHAFGVVSMARDANPNTNGSQFFICLSREGTRHLDGRYTAFGQAISGTETIRAIAAVPIGPNDRPLDPPVVREARLVDAAPFGEGDRPVVDETEQPGR